MESPIRPLVATLHEIPDPRHARGQRHSLAAILALVGYSDWPGLAQVVQIERHVTIKTSGAQRHEVVCGVTSLGPDRAGPAALADREQEPLGPRCDVR